jgi:anti-sigma B factor antagonist
MGAAFTVQSHDSDGVTVLELSGRLVAGGPANVLREAIDEQISRGRKQMVLNLAAVDFIDSTGLGALVIAFTALRKAGGALKLIGLNRRNIELLVLTKLSTVFEVFQDEQDAVNSFYPEREIRRFDILEFVQENKDQPER